FRGWAAGALLFVGALAAASRADSAAPAAAAPAPAAATTAAPAPEQGNVDGAVVPAQCATCGGGLLGAPPADDYVGGGCASCGCSGGCVPGHKPCDCCCDACDGPGRFLCGIYQCICCPDPCYEPHWVALADSAFFQTTGP